MPVKSQTLKNSHGGYAGRSTIERLEIQMDKRRKKLQELRTREGIYSITNENGTFALKEQTLNQGRYEGLAASIALMRGTSVAEEISRSDERLGIE